MLYFLVMQLFLLVVCLWATSFTAKHELLLSQINIQINLIIMLSSGSIEQTD